MEKLVLQLKLDFWETTQIQRCSVCTMLVPLSPNSKVKVFSIFISRFLLNCIDCDILLGALTVFFFFQIFLPYSIKYRWGWNFSIMTTLVQTHKCMWKQVRDGYVHIFQRGKDGGETGSRWGVSSTSHQTLEAGHFIVPEGKLCSQTGPRDITTSNKENSFAYIQTC